MQYKKKLFNKFLMEGHLKFKLHTFEKKSKMFLVFDTETTGFPIDSQAPVSRLDNWPRIVQLSWQVHDVKGNFLYHHDYIIQPDGFDIPFNAQKIHGISTEKALKEGLPIHEVFNKFIADIKETKYIVGHNIEFDLKITASEFFRYGIDVPILEFPTFDTQLLGTPVCRLPGGRKGEFKYPKLAELYHHLFGENFDEAHNAAADVNATARCFFELIRTRQIPEIILKERDLDVNPILNNFSEKVPWFEISIREQVGKSKAQDITSTNLKKVFSTDYPYYFQFHTHTVFSPLQSLIQLDRLIEYALENKMPAVGITDYGNLFGAFIFNNKVEEHNKKQRDCEDFQPLMPIIGCEVYISERWTQDKFTRENPDVRYTAVLLAKNKQGYVNLAKISTIGYRKGLYFGVPRIGKEIIEQYKEGLIATTGDLDSEIPKLILERGEQVAEKAFLWWRDTFGDDFYIQLQRHGVEEEEHVNQVLIRWGKKYGVKLLAQSSVFYSKPEEHHSHEILWCIKENKKLSDEVGVGFNRRTALPTKEFYLKPKEEVFELYADIPDALTNFEEFFKKFEFYSLSRDIVLPKFPIPLEFENESAYLRKLTYDGAKKKYGEITKEVEQRIEYELKVIDNTGYPGYFLIIHDLMQTARERGVYFGPGRGSAVGSIVAYCLNITTIDPLKFDLLFERFLNPERVSMPDIDIDIQDSKRHIVMDIIFEKYGKERVSQIITYSKLGGKSAFRDVARVMDLDISLVNEWSKKFPDKFTLEQLLNKPKEKILSELNNEKARAVQEIWNEVKNPDSPIAKAILEAVKLEGVIRNTGVHPCGTIITPENIDDLVPLSAGKESDMMVCQYDLSVVEQAGLLKMDLLGLTTLNIIQDAVEWIKKTRGIDLNPDEIPLDDPKTLELYQKGETIATFQFESIGMRKNLRLVKPDSQEDLVALNALYRPGPMQYIELFAKRKHGLEPIVYDLPELEEFLKNTYGITVYQEQVMLIAQKIADFTKGQADQLRKAMAKKQIQDLAKLEGLFMENAQKKGYPKDKLEKIWNDWKEFAQYAFNKSHSVGYEVVAFQTAYLKAHYPEEYMTAVLGNNLDQITKIGTYLAECKRMKIKVLGPDVNESDLLFSIPEKGVIRFGLSAIKGVGKNAVEQIIEERNKNGKFKDIFDFVQRVNLQTVNKKVLEALALAGAFDQLDGYHRATYFASDGHSTNIEKLIRYGSSYQDSQISHQNSLFGDTLSEVALVRPKLLDAPKWSLWETLSKEKEVLGIFVSSHPLDNYTHEMQWLKAITIEEFNELLEQPFNQPVTVCGMIQQVEFIPTRNGGFEEVAMVRLEDYSEQLRIRLPEEKTKRYKYMLIQGECVYVKLVNRPSKDQSRLYLDVQHMELLSEVLNKLTELHVWVHPERFSESDFKQFHQIVRENKGDKKLKLRFPHISDDEELEFFASKTKISVNKNLLSELEKIPSIEIRL